MRGLIGAIAVVSCIACSKGDDANAGIIASLVNRDDGSAQ